ncbi:MAG: hypothetical protein KGM49_00710 [Sphingomonadales bacterium]|nr:hypothetical protein [Sphingomonadales bacterium]
MFKSMHIGIEWNLGRGDASDESRAEDAALAVFQAADANPIEAEATYMVQLQELDDEAGMTGLALVYIEARSAANRAATEGWCNPEGGDIAILCGAY